MPATSKSTATPRTVASVPQPSATFNGRRWLKVSQVADYLGISQSSVRRLCESGEIVTQTTLGGHRRCTAESVYQYVNGSQENESTADNQSIIPLALVARVSSRGQATTNGKAEKSSLEHQIERVESYATKEYGAASVENASKYYGVGSGLNYDRKELVQLVADILSGKFSGGFVVADDDLRVMRFGIQLFQQICEAGNCSIVYANKADAQDAYEDLQHSLLGVLTHFTARASGMKAKRLLEVNLDEESLKRAYQLYRHESLSYRQIAALFEKEGRKDPKGRPYTNNIINRNLNENWKALEAVVNGVDCQNSFERFSESHIRKSGPKARLPRKAIYSAYVKWCQREKVHPMSQVKVSKTTQKLGWVWMKSHGNTAVLKGFELN